MQSIQIRFPDEIVALYPDIEELKSVILQDFIASEYIKGNISIRQGANFLGMTYEEFMVDFLGKREISFINGSKVELESEHGKEEAILDEVLSNGQ
jgi:hypothetical protein